MKVEVVFLPPIATELSKKLCVVIDVLRATSTLVAMFEAGVRRITLAGSIQRALDMACTANPTPLVCGESGGLPPAGFDLGNSPREFRRDSVNGRELVFFTSNGTKAMGQLGESPIVLAGSLLNASAVIRAAVRGANEHNLEIAIVCSGDYVGTRFAIDDAFCAGYLCTLIDREAADNGVEKVDFHESARAAMRLFRSYVNEVREDRDGTTLTRQVILRAFWESHNAQVLREVGLSEDVEYCAQIDISDVVPHVVVEGQALVLYPERAQ